MNSEPEKFISSEIKKEMTKLFKETIMVDKHKQSGVFIRMPDDVIKKLEDEAESRMVSKTWLASRLVIEGLRNLKPADSAWLTHQPDLDKQDTIPICPISADGRHDIVEGACVYCSFETTLPAIRFKLPY